VDDVYAQAKQTIRNIEKALAEAGATLADVVRTRTFITDIARFDEMARAHKEAFGEIRPALVLRRPAGLVSRLLPDQSDDRDGAESSWNSQGKQPRNTLASVPVSAASEQ